MFEDRLNHANPWWSSPDAIKDDPAIVKMEHSPLKRAVGEQYRLEARDRTYLLCGPRRVGKTTLLKMEIRRLLGEGVPPDRLLYFSFDSDVRPADIYAIVDEYLAMHRGAGRRFLLFDEVTSVKNWHKAVKNMLDGGKLRGCTLAVTGSQATGVVGPVGHLAGRGDRPMDDAIEAVLDPMSFGEYASLRDPEIRAELRRLSLDSGRARLDAVRRMMDGELPAPVRGLLASTTALSVHFRSYLLAGGMPAVANQLAAENTIPDETFDSHEAALRTDAMGAGLEPGAVARMLPPVARSVGSPVSWSSLRDAATIESHRLMDDYAGALSDMFLLRVIYRYDSSGDAPKTNVPKKVYFRDPSPSTWRRRPACGTGLRALPARSTTRRRPAAPPSRQSPAMSRAWRRRWTAAPTRSVAATMYSTGRAGAAARSTLSCAPAVAAAPAGSSRSRSSGRAAYAGTTCTGYSTSGRPSRRAREGWC